MRKPFTDDGPNQPLSLIIDCDDPFANRDSIGEGYNSGAGFELCVNNKTWHQPGVQSANVLDRRPDLIRLFCGCNLFPYSSHTPSHSDAANRHDPEFVFHFGPHKGRNLGVILRLVVTQSSGKTIALIAVAARNVCF